MSFSAYRPIKLSEKWFGECINGDKDNINVTLREEFQRRHDFRDRYDFIHPKPRECRGDIRVAFNRIPDNKRRA
jgi:hypothetical protein